MGYVPLGSTYITNINLRAEGMSTMPTLGYLDPEIHVEPQILNSVEVGISSLRFKCLSS